MQYAVFPMKTISISQRANGTLSHQGLQAWDLAGEDTGIDCWYAPCRIKVLAINPQSWMANTVFFGSCDEEGNSAKVICEDRNERILTFSCTHMDTTDKHGLALGKIYQSGDCCYQEGSKGLASGNHVHMEVAEGWTYNKAKNNTTNQWETIGITTIDKIFYQLDGFNIIGGKFKSNGYTFKTISTRDNGITEPTASISITGYGLFVNKLGLNIRQSATANSQLITTVPVGKELKIRYFLDAFQSDGYQWAATEYHGYIGFSQIDTKGYYTVVLTANSVINPSTGVCVAPRMLTLVASNNGAFIRSSIPSGSRTFVPASSRMKVEDLIPGFQSDGYQWIKVSYIGLVGFVQADVKSWHYFNI